MAMRTTSLEDRITILALADAGHTDADIAHRVGCSVRTVRKWRCRSRKQGRVGLASKMGRPPVGAMGTFPVAVLDAVQAMRHVHPGWGPLTLNSELKRDAVDPDSRLPSRPTIARWLEAHGLTRSYERHQDLPKPSAPSAEVPHQEWEMDARGHEIVPDVGVVTLINLNDRCSKTKLLSYPCWLGQDRARRHATTEDYQLAFRLTACDWGLPNRLYVDRDSVYYDNSSKSPFPTRFHLWLLALGVELVIGPAHQPQKRGQTERSHQTWFHQVVEGQTFASLKELERALRQRRAVMNESLPCASLGGQPPLAAFPEACSSPWRYRPEWEADEMDLGRVYAYLARCHWFRTASNIGAVTLGEQRYALGRGWARKEVEITFDPADQHLVFKTPTQKEDRRLPIKGLSKARLMGELAPLVGLDHYQLALPFTPDECRVARLSETLLTRLIET